MRVSCSTVKEESYLKVKADVMLRFSNYQQLP